MSQTAQRLTFSFEDYLAWEQKQSQRHEFIRGEVFAMAGGTDLHNEASGNLYMALRQHLRGSPCRVYMADVKVRVEKANCSLYPDLLVTCAESDHGDRYLKRSPLLIIEVLSPSTAAFDLGEKFAIYRQLDSLREYVLVDPERVRIQIYRRQDAQWIMDSIGADESLRLNSIDLECPITAVYQDLAKPPLVGLTEDERQGIGPK